MANEITAVTSLSASKGGASINTVGSSGSSTKQSDMTGEAMGSGVLSVSNASDSAIPIPAGVGSCKYLYLRNLDSTNYVEFSYATGGSFAARVRVDAGCSAIFRPTSTTCYLKANTAPCDVFWAAVEE